MPNKMKCITFTEVVPAACSYTQAVSDYRSKYDTNHSVKLCQNNRTNNISAYLERITDIITELVAITVYHLLKIENNNRQECIYRSKTIILQSFIQNIPCYVINAEINILDKKYGKC